MGTLTSTLILRLIDGVSGPAKGAKASLRSLDATAVAAARRRENTERRVAAFTRAGATMAAVGAAAAGYAAVQGTKRFAELERRMTRIAITADASAEEQRAAFRSVQDIAQATAQPVEDVMGGVEALVAQGRSLASTMAFLPSVAATAQASGAAVNDIANAAGAVADQLDISAERMQHAFDIMAAGGKAGKFELRDMAQYLPSLAAQAGAVGLKGEEGLRKLVALLQVVRNQTGDSSEAATSLQNIFAKMESDETAKKFKKFGIDLRKEMALARKEGVPLVDAFVSLADRALKGDLSKLPQLFTDMEFARGMRALLSQKGAVEAMSKALSKVAGTSQRDLDRVLGDAQASIDRISNSYDRLVSSLGRTADRVGIDDALGAISSWLDANLDKLDRGASAFDQINAAVDGIKRTNPEAGGAVDGIKREVKNLKELLYYASGAAVIDSLSGPDLTSDPSRPAANEARSRAEAAENRAAELEAALALETDKRKRADLSAEIAKAKNAGASERRAQGVHAARDITDYEAGLALAKAGIRGQRLFSTTPREASENAAWRAGLRMRTTPSGFVSETAWSGRAPHDRFTPQTRTVPDTPLAHKAAAFEPPDVEAQDLTEAGRQTGATFLAGLKSELDRAVAEAQSAGQQIKAALSVTATPKINMPNVNRALGNATQGRMDASFSDHGSRN